METCHVLLISFKLKLQKNKIVLGYLYHNLVSDKKFDGVLFKKRVACVLISAMKKMLMWWQNDYFAKFPTTERPNCEINYSFVINSLVTKFVGIILKRAYGPGTNILNVKDVDAVRCFSKWTTIERPNCEIKKTSYKKLNND